MEQRHWWKEDRYWHRGEACRNESDSPLFLEMIAEATRQGIQQGKREAWEEAKQMTHDVAGRNDSNGRYNACEEMREEIIAKLSSLDNSSKERV